MSLQMFWSSGCIRSGEKLSFMSVVSHSNLVAYIVFNVCLIGVLIGVWFWMFDLIQTFGLKLCAGTTVRYA